MNLFRKAMLAVVTMILAVVTIVVPANRTTEVEAATPTTLYLTPNSNWKSDNARFAAYFFGNGEKWVSMTKTAGQTDMYQVSVPSGFSKVIFCRMNPSATANNWNNRWNQTGDLTIPTTGNNHFKVPSGAWDGSTTGWTKYTPTVEVTKYKVTYFVDGVENTSKEIEEGSALDLSVTPTKAGYVFAYWCTDAELTTPASDAATVKAATSLYAKFYETFGEGVALYLKPNSNWLSDSARFAAYFFNSSDNAWVDMTLIDSAEKIYKVVSPAGDWENVIFCRMNPSFSANNWDNDNKWGQTSNLIYDHVNNLFTIDNESWDTGVWSAYTEPVVEPEVKTSIAWQQGTLNDAAALRIVVILEGLTTENVADFVKEISIKTTHAGIADTQVVDVLFTGVVDLATGDAITGDLYAVLTYTNIPTGEYAIEVLFDGAVVATETATIV